jgi:UDP-2,4-diacetamido-2,4,6-trideoxy-beta-L-altropyranose hydrolase
MNRSLLLRVDASQEIGVGHAMRCLALAQAWQDAGGEIIFVSAEMPETLGTRLEREQCRVMRISSTVGSSADAGETGRLAWETGADWVVVDGARFGPEYIESLRDEELKVLLIDDGGRLARYAAEIVLNQNLAATPSLYAGKVGEMSTLLLGPRHALLRREFRGFDSWVRPPARNPRRVLVSFGGGDVENFTAGVLRGLSAGVADPMTVIALAGVTNRHVAELRALAAAAPFPCEVRVGVDNVAVLMAWADVAITSAGSTVWELASLRLPSLIADIGDGQLQNLGALETIPLFRVIPVGELATRDLAADLSAPVRSSVKFSDLDARGATRVVAALRTAPALSLSRP